MSTPKSTAVQMMHEVPLDPKYNHTILFPNIDAQISYFNSKIIATANFNYLSYQRYQLGTIRVQSDMTLLDNANYLRFYNPYHEDKSFYAFILAIRYVSDSVVEIDYKIDNIQTWMFDYTLNPCYVDREHTLDDTVGTNRVTEGLDTGEYICAGIEQILPWNFNDTAFFLVASMSPAGAQHSSVEGNVYSSLYLKHLHNINQLENELQAFKDGATSSLDPIMMIAQYPKQFWNEDTQKLTFKRFSLQLDQSIGFGGFKALDPKTQSVKTYIPKNNKLYQYPYNYMVFESPDGSNNILKYENFKSNNIHEFWLLFSVFPEVESMCAPMDYESSSYQVNFQKALFCKTYPVCGVATDAFNAWWAQNKYSMPIVSGYLDASDIVSNANRPTSSPTSVNSGGFSHRSGKIPNEAGALWPSQNYSLGASERTSGALRGAMSDIAARAEASAKMAKDVAQFAMRDESLSSRLITAGMGVGGIGALLNGNIGSLGSLAKEIGLQLAAVEGHRAIPDSTVTKANGGGILHNAAMDNYKVYYTQIRPEYAEIIDNYFSCFGYATHKVKVPNITGRRNWNYIKTEGCTIKGSVPVEAETDIAAAYDRGITFWHNPANIHDYSTNNDIIV